MKTSVDEFDLWLSLIPSDFYPHLIPTRRGGKAPLVPRGRSWKEEAFRLKTEKARWWLKQGGNVAFVTRKDLAVIDVDDEEKARELLGDHLFDTLTVSTRSGGSHLYFVNGGVENADYAEAVEVRVEWRYLLVPGSYVDPGDTGGNGRYEVLVERPPALLVPDDLPEELKRSKVEMQELVPILRQPGEPFKNRHGWTLQEIRGEDEKLDRLLAELNPLEHGYPSTSEADMGAAEKLVYWEFEPPVVAAILMEFRNRRKVRDRPDYVERTVRRAVENSKGEETISDHVDPETWEPGASDIFDEITIGGENEDE